MSTVPTATSIAAATGRLYLVRALIALVWAGLLAVALSSAGTLGPDSGLPGFAVVLLILYPVVDVVASLVDARTQRASGIPGVARTQLVNAVISTVTTLAVVVAALDGPASVLRVFGAWALLTGLIQLSLAVARRRRGQRGQWAMIISGGLSAVIGLTFVTAASEPEISLGGVNGYAVGGAILYLVSAYRLFRAARA
ncbi:DUF308 domain-containing protein [Actinoplanes sp. NPDC051494]|uniref:DUF308 domain-containing protein n=1 Tax=Actinoplanes sp. NPDC051494 TaxID=3363907 RepID=UPI0037A58971